MPYAFVNGLLRVARALHPLTARALTTSTVCAHSAASIHSIHCLHPIDWAQSILCTLRQCHFRRESAIPFVIDNEIEIIFIL